MNNIGIYIHFPFCVSKCKYCNFNSYSNKNDLQIKYFQSLLKEIEMYSNKENFSLGTIVNHKIFGTGAVIDIDGDLLKIAFNSFS